MFFYMCGTCWDFGILCIMEMTLNVAMAMDFTHDVTFCLIFLSLVRAQFFPNPLPHTITPEYEAANRAYMRYHNMNPIFGISSK